MDPVRARAAHTACGLNEICGRIQAAGPDPTDPTTIYLGGDSGGIWKNANLPNWTPLTDHMPRFEAIEPAEECWVSVEG